LDKTISLLKYILPILVLVYFNKSRAQTVVWSEDFDGNAGSGSNWGILNQDIGVQGNYANLWYVSCQENGMSVGSCGAGCGTNQTLHLGSTTAGDLGAAYDAGGLCWLGLCTNTDRRSQSLNINTVGFSNLTLNFDYIELGDGSIDNCVVEYSTDGGVSWALLVDSPKTPVCVSGQGLWTAYSIALPSACDNIPNLRIAFRWQNNDDGIGTDPSFAVNDITITTPIVLPVELTRFMATGYKDFNQINWTTLSETNSDYFTLQRSKNGQDWSDVTNVKAQGFSTSTTNYTFKDFKFYTGVTYYRLKQVDFNGDVYFSSAISVLQTNKQILSIFPNPVKDLLTVSISDKRISKVELMSQTGKMLKIVDTNTNSLTINLKGYHSGIYILKVTTFNGEVFYRRIVKGY